MPKLLLTDKNIKSLPIPEKGRLDIADVLLPGLHLRVTPNGVRTWSVMYRVKGDARKRRRTYGPYPRVTLAEARALAREDLNAAALGKDPAAVAATTLTFEELACQYMERHAKPKKRSWKQDDWSIQKYLLPAWGSRPASEIRRKEVLALLDAIAQTAPIGANRVLALVSSIYTWGLSVDLVDANPAYKVRRPSPETPGERVLSDSELVKIWEKLEENWRGENTIGNPIVGRVIATRLLLGVRTTEVLAMTWDDVEDDWWFQPGSITKNKKSNAVPLPPLFKETVLDRLERRETLVFGSWGGATIPLFITRLWQAAGVKRFEARDLRRTFITNMARLKVPRETRQRWVNHSRGGGVHEVHYDRYDYRDELLAASATMESFFRALFQPGPGAKVMPFSR